MPQWSMYPENICDIDQHDLHNKSAVFPNLDEDVSRQKLVAERGRGIVHNGNYKQTDKPFPQIYSFLVTLVILKYLDFVEVIDFLQIGSHKTRSYFCFHRGTLR